jgi:hypothetical protein
VLSEVSRMIPKVALFISFKGLIMDRAVAYHLQGASSFVEDYMAVSISVQGRD